MEQFVTRLPEIFIELIVFAFALSLHESAHGWMAERCGDPTARWLGRITLNPIKHIDPFGSILLPIIMAVTIGTPFGWAKPVPFVPRNLRNPRRDPVLVALAGPGSNLLAAFGGVVILILAKLAVPGFGATMEAAVQRGSSGMSGIAAPLAFMLFALIWVNLILGVLNLIPIPPLDGSKLLTVLLPSRVMARYWELERYGMVVVLLLWVTGLLGRLLTFLLVPAMIFLGWLIRL
jgi:Zn-dependent protease